MDDMRLVSKEQILANASALPSPPMLVLELLRLLDDDDVAIGRLSAAVAKDAALAGDLLKTVNSAAFGLSSKVTSIDRAIPAIGLRGFRSLLGKRAMRAMMSAGDAPVMVEIRRRSLVNATLARAFALELDGAIGEEAFLAGLLGSLGHLALAHGAPEIHITLAEMCHGWPRESVERTVLGFSVDEITAELLAQWSMPEILSEAVRLRAPGRSGLTPRQANPMLIAALRLALWGEYVLFGSAPSEDLAELMDDVRGTIGLDLLRVSEILIEAEAVAITLAEDLAFEAPIVGSHAERVDAAVLGLNGTAVDRGA